MRDCILCVCKKDAEPIGAIGLLNCIVVRESQFNGRDNVFKVTKYSGQKQEIFYLQGQSSEDVTALV